MPRLNAMHDNQRHENESVIVIQVIIRPRHGGLSTDRIEGRVTSPKPRSARVVPTIVERESVPSGSRDSRWDTMSTTERLLRQIVTGVPSP